MRSEQEMMELITQTAREDDRIRAVYMNGSRTNPNAVKDIFQDYDIVYVVTDTKPFYEEETWIDRFGKRLFMQMPEKMDKLRGYECHWEETYGWLMQFQDGNRLDLHVSAVEYARKDILTDRLCKVLLDKDGILPQMPEASEADHYVRKPSEAEFLCDCNDFWWCLNNVAKGLWREEIPYVMDMLYQVVRPYFMKVLSWKIGVEHDFSCSVGKSGKYMYRYLPREVWQTFLTTYPDGEAEHIWQAVFTMCDMFEEAAKEVALALKYAYQEEEAKASREYLRRVYNMPPKAYR